MKAAACRGRFTLLVLLLSGVELKVDEGRRKVERGQRRETGSWRIRGGLKPLFIQEAEQLPGEEAVVAALLTGTLTDSDLHVLAFKRATEFTLILLCL